LKYLLKDLEAIPSEAFTIRLMGLSSGAEQVPSVAVFAFQLD